MPTGAARLRKPLRRQTLFKSSDIPNNFGSLLDGGCIDYPGTAFSIASTNLLAGNGLRRHATHSTKGLPAEGFVLNGGHENYW